MRTRGIEESELESEILCSGKEKTQPRGHRGFTERTERQAKTKLACLFVFSVLSVSPP